LPDLEIISKSQCFALYTYQTAEPKPVELSLGDAEKDGCRLNVSDFALKAYRAAYKDAKIGKEDIFYYVYGILHSPEYKTRFAADLTKMLPRIPLAADFWAFSQAGASWRKSISITKPPRRIPSRNSGMNWSWTSRNFI